MIKLIDREEIFFKSVIVDHCISELQRGYGFDEWVEGTKPDVHHDHLQPFHIHQESLDDFAVIGYVRKNQRDYLTLRSNAMIRFFELMSVQQLYLMDELKYDWMEFPFGNRDKKQLMKSIVNRPSYHEAFELNIDDLKTILPLFSYVQRHSTPIIWLFPANAQAKFRMFLCDDGNFHISFVSRDREKMSAAASDAGLVVGGLEVCQIK